MIYVDLQDTSIYFKMAFFVNASDNAVIKNVAIVRYKGDDHRPGWFVRYEFLGKIHSSSATFPTALQAYKHARRMGA